MKFGSVCSGIEAASQAWNTLGWKASWLAEIEPFPCSVLAHHYPDTPNLGDMRNFESWPDDEKHAIDLLCGGTPCQSFSVAGLRKGLDDARGNLMLTFASIAAKYRPKWLVWENVPGVLSSNAGRDFSSFLGLLSGQSIEAPKGGWGNSGVITGYKNAYSLAYRVLDAQYFGVAQRRRRVFVVGCIGANRNAAAVLFERHSLSGNPAPSRCTQENIARAITAGAFSGGAGCRPDGAAANHFVPVIASGKPTVGTIMANCGAKQWLGNQEAFTGDYHVLTPIALAGNTIGRAPKNGGNGLGYDNSGVMYTLTKTDQHAIAFSAKDNGRDATTELSPTLCNQHTGMAVAKAMRVRRLTEIECERLQGFPDNYTQIPYRGKTADQCPGSPRYKALGNSWAVPVAAWIGKRIMEVEKIA